MLQHAECFFKCMCDGPLNTELLLCEPAAQHAAYSMPCILSSDVGCTQLVKITLTPRGDAQSVSTYRPPSPRDDDRLAFSTTRLLFVCFLYPYNPFRQRVKWFTQTQWNPLQVDSLFILTCVIHIFLTYFCIITFILPSLFANYYLLK